MVRGRNSHGYTILEVLIFLAVSAGLFVSVMTMIGGKQGRTEFSHKSREFEIKLQDLANDVATGYYANGSTGSGYIKCDVVGGGPSVPGNITITTSASDRQGANSKCIFIGRSIQVNPGGDSEHYNQYSLVGRRSIYSATTSKPDVSNLKESGVAVIAPGLATNTGFPDLAEVGTSRAFKLSCIISARANVGSLAMPSDKPCANIPGGGFKADNFSFITTFQGVSAVTNNRDSGDTQVNLYIRDSSLPTSPSIPSRDTRVVVDEINAYSTQTPGPASALVKDPPSGIYICLESQYSRQFGLLRIGGGGSRFSTDLTIKDGSCS